jgi:hypothetical protein
MIVDIPKTKNDTQLLRMIDQGMSFSSTLKSRRDDIMVAPGVSPVPQDIPVYPRVVHMIV